VDYLFLNNFTELTKPKSHNILERKAVIIVKKLEWEEVWIFVTDMEILEPVSLA